MRHVTWIIGLLAVIAPCGQADIIIFEHESVSAVTGRIGETDFTAPFIITATGDTDDRTRNGTAWSIAHISATIDIDGVGVFEFISPTRTFVQEVTETVGFSRDAGGGRGLDLFDGPSHPDFHDWEMLTSIGPIAGNDGILTQWDREPLIQTTGGILFIEERFDLNVVFTATVIPAPAAFGAFTLLWTVRRRRR